MTTKNHFYRDGALANNEPVDDTDRNVQFALGAIERHCDLTGNDMTVIERAIRGAIAGAEKPLQHLADTQAALINLKNDEIARLSAEMAQRDDRADALANDSDAGMIETMAAALEETALALWSAGDPELAEMACALEGVVKLVNPAFALCGVAPAAPITEESALYAHALNHSDCAPASREAGEDKSLGSQSRE
jgi:hypothetical protein